MTALTKKLPCLLSNSWKVNSVEQHPTPLWVLDGTRTGESVQGWRKKIRDGSNAGSPYTVFRISEMISDPMNFGFTRRNWRLEGSTLQPTGGTETFVCDGHQNHLLNNGVGQFSHVASISATAATEALTKVYDRIREDSYSANGLLVLGELRETIRMLRNPLESARKATVNYLSTLKSLRTQVKQLRRKKSETSVDFRQRKLVAVKDGMSGTWLELQFGLKPMISDAKEIVEGIGKALTQPTRKGRISGRSPVVVGNSSTAGVQDVVPNLTSTVTRSWNSEASVRYVVGMKHTLVGPSSLVESMGDRLGFQVQNFVPTIYELIPYSFLIDYFVNLGDIISAACTDTTAVTWVSRTDRISTVYSITEQLATYHESWTHNTWHPQSLMGKTSGLRRFGIKSITRTIPVGLPMPTLHVSVPGTDSLKWVNMAALLASARDFRFRR